MKIENAGMHWTKYPLKIQSRFEKASFEKKEIKKNRPQFCFQYREKENGELTSKIKITIYS